MPSQLHSLHLIRDSDLGGILKNILAARKVEISVLKKSIEAVELVSERSCDLVLAEVEFDEMTGLDILKIVRQVDPFLPVILFSSIPDVSNAVDAIRSGAENYFHSPWKKKEIAWAVDRALHTRHLYRKNQYLEEVLSNRYHFDQIIASSGKMQDVLEMVKRVAPTPATVLIEGDSGTGKELIARAIHFNSPRRSEKMVKVNSAAIPESLLESELFGHEKGSFTGAFQKKIGKFEQADGGTLFLDEISELSMGLQAKLLRAIQEREIERVGGLKRIHVDIRLVAATNRNLEERIRDGLFREDLYHRIHVVPIRIPPLRDRCEDIPDLVDFFLRQNSRRLNLNPPKRLSRQVMDLLLTYPWPGNIRELENLVERLCILSAENVVYPADLPARFRTDLPVNTSIEKLDDNPDILPLEIITNRYISHVLKLCNGNKTLAAARLGMSLRGLHNRLKKIQDAR